MKQPKSFEEGMDRLQGLLTQLQDEATPLADSVNSAGQGPAAGRGDRRQPCPGCGGAP